MHTDLQQQQHLLSGRDNTPTSKASRAHPTCELRALLLHILEREPRIARVLGLMPERLGLYDATQPDDEQSRLLIMLNSLQPGEQAVPMGRLLALSEHGQPLLRQWVALDQGVDDSPALLRFIHDYLVTVLPGLLGLYLLYGVTVQTHRQNSFLVISPHGRPSRLILRNITGIRLHGPTLHGQGLGLRSPPLSTHLSDDAARVRGQFLHTTFMCHFGELIQLCTRHWPVHEYALWRELARHVDNGFEHWREQVEPQRWTQERQAMLEQDWPSQPRQPIQWRDRSRELVDRQNNPLKMRR